MPLSPRTPLGAIGILGLSFALVWHLPALSVGSSLAATFAVLYVLAIAAEVAYWLVLYPAFFTPFKHLPVPPVSLAFALTHLVLLTFGLLNRRRDGAFGMDMRL
jgi:hypothetical protein